MSLRFLFQQPPSGGESECKDTTIFQTTKKNFRLKTQQGGATTDLQQLEIRKNFQKVTQELKNSPQKERETRRQTQNRHKQAQNSAKTELLTEIQKVKA